MMNGRLDCFHFNRKVFHNGVINFECKALWRI